MFLFFFFFFKKKGGAGPIIPRDHVASYGSLSLLSLQLRSGRGNNSVYYVTVVVVGQQVSGGVGWGSSYRLRRVCTKGRGRGVVELGVGRRKGWGGGLNIIAGRSSGKTSDGCPRPRGAE